MPPQLTTQEQARKKREEEARRKRLAQQQQNATGIKQTVAGNTQLGQGPPNTQPVAAPTEPTQTPPKASIGGFLTDLATAPIKPFLGGGGSKGDGPQGRALREGETIEQFAPPTPGPGIPTTEQAVGNIGQEGVVGFNPDGTPIISNVGVGVRDVQDPRGGAGLIGGTAFLPDQVGQLSTENLQQPLIEFSKSVASRIANNEDPTALINDFVQQLQRTSTLGAAPQLGAGLQDPNIQIAQQTAQRAAPATGGQAQTDVATQALLESLGISQEAFAGRANLGQEITAGLGQFIKTGNVPPAFQNTLGAQFDDLALARQKTDEEFISRTGGRGTRLQAERNANARAFATEGARLRGEQNQQLFDLASQLGLSAPETFGGEARATAGVLGDIGGLDFNRSAFNAAQEQEVNLTQFQGNLQSAIAQGQLDQGTFFALMNDATTRDLEEFRADEENQLAQFAANEQRDLQDFAEGNLNARQQADLFARNAERQIQRDQLNANTRLAERDFKQADAFFREGLITQIELNNIQLNLTNALAKAETFNSFVTSVFQTSASERNAEKGVASSFASGAGNLAGTLATIAALK